MFRMLTPLAAAATAVVLLSTPAVADAGPPPSSMAALGDSISRGFNACGWFSDCTSRAWSAGDNTTVNSHYLRIRTKNRAIAGHVYNDAKTGAKSDAVVGQAQSAASQGAEYVTILIGANDACTSSESAMTPVATFRSRIDSALATLRAAVAGVRVFISSLPDLKRLWSVGKDNSSARSAWSTFGICQSVLANPTSTAPADASRRDRVRQRVIDYNSELAASCAAFGANCRFDDNAAFNYPFVLSQVNTWDYFHPNAEGQRVLADISYTHGFDW